MRYCLLFLLLLQPVFLYSQSMLQGRLLNEEKETVVGASVLLLQASDSTTLAFAISKADGQFSLVIPEEAPALDSLRLHIRSLGYQPLQLAIQQPELGSITLTNSSQLLKEVTVKGAPVTTENDTISYSIGAFADTEDRSLEDVLKKLPGIKIGENGAIEYQGQKINKFYIEGLDLLEGRYALATQNIPHEKIASVQVMENHQPVKMLQGKAPSFDPALNVTLKDKTAFTGKAALGAGLPELARLNLTPMLFQQDQQLIASLQFNNTGEDISQQLQVLGTSSIRELSHQQDPEPGLGFPSLRNAYFAKERMLFNQSIMGSLNLIRRTKKGDWKLLLDYSHNREKEKVSSTFAYATADTLTIAEERNTRFKKQQLKAKAIFERNNKEEYLTNTLSVNLYQHQEETDIRQSDSQYFQPVNQQAIKVSNTLSKKSWWGNRLITFDSYIDFQHAPEKMQLSPLLLPAGELQLPAYQQLQPYRFTSNHSLKGGKMLGSKLLWQSELGMEYNYSQFNTFIDAADGASLPDSASRNQLNTQFLQPYLTQWLRFTSAKWKIEASLPLQWQQLSLTDPLHRINKQATKLALSPRLNLHYRISPLLSANGMLTYKTSPQPEQRHYGLVARNYRSSKRLNAPIFWTDSWNSSLGLKYKHPINLLFFYLIYQHSLRERDYLSSTQIDENGNMLMAYLPQSNQQTTQRLIFNASKSLFGQQLHLNTAVNAQANTHVQLINDLPTAVELNSLKTTLNLDYTALSWLSVNATYQKSWHQNHFSEQRFRFQEQEINFDTYFFYQQHTLGFKQQHYQQTQTTPVFFSDIVYRYQPANSKRKLLFELSWQNIFNEKQLISRSFSAMYRQQAVYYLRPAQILLTVKSSLIGKGRK